MDADSANGDDFGELDYLDAYARLMLYGGWEWQDKSSSRVSNGGSPVASAVAASGRNVVVMEKLRRQKLNDKLYALHSVVPDITKMDKLSIIKDAAEYVQQLQEEERRMLAVLEQLAPTEEPDAPCAHQAVPPMKNMRRFPSSSPTSVMAATSPRIEDLEVNART